MLALSFGKLVIAFITVLSYPSTGDPVDTFVMDLACNLDDDCEITIPRCEEDEPCWNCATMGNRICGN